MIRIFERPTSKTTQWKELIAINESENTIKIYNQDKQLGFPFSEYATSLSEYGYKSADDYFKIISKREKNNIGHINIREIEATEQIASEISGLVKLAKHLNDNGKYTSIIKRDGTLYNDIIERVKAYGLTEENALELINLCFDYNIERHAVKVIFEGDSSFTTSINGTPEEIKNYYVNHSWDIGNVETEEFKLCEKVEFLY